MGDVLQKIVLSPFAVKYIPIRTVFHGLEPFRRAEHGPLTNVLYRNEFENPVLRRIAPLDSAREKTFGTVSTRRR
jgi:hypothetical protein